MKRVIVISFALLYITTLAWSQGITRTTQSIIFLPIDTAPSIDYKYRDGTALLTDGRLLKGRFQYNGRKIFVYRASSQAAKQRIALSMIKRLVLAGSDTLVTYRSDSTVFVRLGNRLLRQLTDGSPMVLDRKFAVDEDRGKTGRRMFVLDEDGTVRKFTSLQKFNRWFYAYRERSGKQTSDTYLNQSEIVKAVARLNE
ncbi:hypothetical protein [Spirosoma validum]|uniref:Uncharacterized protein n=1 Tax=Spirosoma validum TaxID=2771355 RepID=A0A927GFC4_9BACT|nr:hypothetical protein [Spirosoma validum]MBD2755694.1 hypothetical protein [Spirosoma validum]